MLLPYASDRGPTLRPYATLSVLLATVVVAVALAFGERSGGPSEKWLYILGLVPAHFQPLTLLTYPFVHEGFGHLLLNAFYLWVFGAGVENAVGRGRFLALYLAGGAVGGALQTLVTLSLLPPATAAIPIVGASAACAGLIGLYAVRYYRARLAFVGLPFRPHVVAVVAVFLAYEIGAGLWSLGAGAEAAGVAHWAHVGGFIFGLSCAYLLKLDQAGERAYLTQDARQDMDTNEPGAAIRRWEQLLAREPDSATARVELARAWLALGDSEQASESYLAAIAFQLSRNARVEAALLYAEMREKGLNDAPLPTGQLFALGGALEEVERFDLAAQTLRALTVRAPDSVEAETASLKVISLYVHRLDRREEARILLRLFKERYPHSAGRALADDLLKAASAGLVLLIAILGAGGLAGRVQASRAAPATPSRLAAPAARWRFLPAEPTALANGLRVLVRERHVTPLVAIDLWVRAGAREERPDELGCAHFLEHTLFKGTATRGAGQADIDVENLGATLNAATGPDYAHFYTTVASEHLEAALRVVADVIENATLPDGEVERERGVILDELARRDSDPMARLVDLLYARGLSASAYRHSPGGTAGAIAARGRDTLAAFYRRTYAPARCALVLAGDVTPEQGRELARRVFGGWQASSMNAGNGREDAPPRADVEKGMGDAARNRGSRLTTMGIERLRIADAGLSAGDGRVGFAFPAPAASEGRWACAALAAVELLGPAEGGGRLALAGLASFRPEARCTPRRDGSLFCVLASLAAEANSSPRSFPRSPSALSASSALKEGGEAGARLETLAASLLRAVAGLGANPVFPAELNAAKQRLLGRLQFDTETNQGLARAVGYAEITGGDGPEAFRARVLALTPADMQQFARRYLNPDRALRLELAPPASSP